MASADVRVPPSNLDAEAAVLSACLLDGTHTAVDAARALLTEFDFYADANRLVFRAILDLDAAKQPIDVVLVAQLLRERNDLERIGGTPYLAQLADATPAVAHVAEHAQVIADKSRVRRMIARLQVGIAEAYGGLEDVITWSQTLATEIGDIASVDQRDPPELLEEIVPRVLTDALARNRHGVTVSGIDTGWRDYTQALGGWKRGKLHVVGGRPGMGKTSFVLGAALNVAAQGLGVVFFSAEMDKSELAQRALAVASGVNTRSIESGNLTTAEWEAVQTAAVWLKTLPLSILFKPGGRVSDVRSAVRIERNRLAKRGTEQLGLVIVDYLQLLNGDKQRGEQREAEVARVTKDLTWLAGEFDVPLLGVSQLNRALENRSNKSKRPTLADLRESGAIEQDAYSVTLLYREEYYDKSTEWAGTVEAIIAKLRGGHPKAVRLAFLAESTRIANLDGQEDLTF